MIDRSGRSIWWRTAVVALGCTLMAAGGLAGAAEGRKPDATIEFSEASVAVGVGYSWGKGVLVYRGDRHPFRINGLTAGEVGGEQVRARGEVYNLHRVADFAGTYTSAGAGATVGGGFDVEVMRNSNGVELKLISTTKGADLRTAIEGVTITLEGSD
jgi:hypothetical protein